MKQTFVELPEAFLVFNSVGGPFKHELTCLLPRKVSFYCSKNKLTSHFLSQNIN